MRQVFFLFFICGICLGAQAQKKNKGKDKDKTDFAVADSIPPTSKNSKKGKDDKKDDKKGKSTSVNFKEPVTEPKPVADTSKRFLGMIKYRITSDDPADQDSVFVIFGENKIRVVMFIAGYREGQIFQKNMIANLKDSSFIELDDRKMTYKVEKFSDRNDSTIFTLENSKKTGQVMKLTCQEYKGEMTTKEGEVFEAACLVSNQYYCVAAQDYNFMNVHPLVLGYKVVLGFRTRTADNENTYIMAYQIEPGNTDSWFDISQYHPK